MLSWNARRLQAPELLSCVATMVFAPHRRPRAIKITNRLS